MEKMQAAVFGNSPSDVATEAFRREALLDDTRTASKKIQELESGEEFAAVSEGYKVIDTDTLTVIIPAGLADRLEAGELVAPRDLMMHSVQLWESGIERYIGHGLIAAIAESGMYRWLGPYDRFLGYMAGVLNLGTQARQAQRRSSNS